MADRYYITTAIDYANGPPHLGHALEKVGADAMARYHRLKGERVRFVLGNDEHGLKVMQSAEAAGVTPQEWVDALAAEFEAMWSRLSVSFDDFIRTSQPRHHAGVEAMIRRMQTTGDLYTSTYSGYYCVGCEAYKTEDELEGGRCPIHPTREISWMEEANWFFRLSRYQDRLLRLLDERPEFVQPEIRRNEIRRVIEGGLDDISVSRRRLPWGIPWPGDADQTVYVWIDALTNYLTAVGFPEDGHREWWPASVHVIGKDITRFHCIYWPAMLMSAEIELPRTVWAHGFLTSEGQKISKSAGVWVDLDEAIERHGADAFRYYLLREVPWNGDGDFSWARFDERYTADLADNVGNLASRTLSMIEKYREGVVPAGAPTRFEHRIADALVRYRGAMDANLLHLGVSAALELARETNGFIVERQPWKQAKEAGDAAELDATLAALARSIGVVAALLEPFVPGKARALAERLGMAEIPRLDELASLDLSGRRVQKGDVLFPKPEPSKG